MSDKPLPGNDQFLSISSRLAHIFEEIKTLSPEDKDRAIGFVRALSSIDGAEEKPKAKAALTPKDIYTREEVDALLEDCQEDVPDDDDGSLSLKDFDYQLDELLTSIERLHDEDQPVARQRVFDALQEGGHDLGLDTLETPWLG